MTTRSWRRDVIEASLIRFGIDYSPPEPGGRRTWRIRVAADRIAEASTGEAEWFAAGLVEGARQAQEGRRA